MNWRLHIEHTWFCFDNVNFRNDKMSMPVIDIEPTGTFVRDHATQTPFIVRYTMNEQVLRSKDLPLVFDVYPNKKIRNAK